MVHPRYFSSYNLYTKFSKWFIAFTIQDMPIQYRSLTLSKNQQKKQLEACLSPIQEVLNLNSHLRHPSLFDSCVAYIEDRKLESDCCTIRVATYRASHLDLRAIIFTVCSKMMVLAHFYIFITCVFCGFVVRQRVQVLKRRQETLHCIEC